MATVRVCMCPGCESSVTAPHLCCVRHWRALPSRVQTEVQARLRGWKDTGAAREFLSRHYSATKGVQGL